MAGESKPLTVKIRAAMARELKTTADQPCSAKRKAEEAAAGEERGAKRKAEEEAAAGSEGEQAREKKMTRLPQEEVRRILTHVADDRVPRDYEALKRQNPSLLPSPEEEADPWTALLYRGARLFYDGGERIARFDAFVRREYEKRGYVEVDEDFLAQRAQVRAWSDAARARVLKEFADSNLEEDLD